MKKKNILITKKLFYVCQQDTADAATVTMEKE